MGAQSNRFLQRGRMTHGCHCPLGTFSPSSGCRRARSGRDARAGFRAGCLGADGGDHRSRDGDAQRDDPAFLRGARCRVAAGGLAQPADLRDGDAQHAVQPLRSASGRQPPRRAGVGRSAGNSPPSSCRRSERRDLYRIESRTTTRWRLARTVRGGCITEERMDLALFERKSEFEWRIKPFGKMHVPGVIFASETLMREMDAKVYEQVTNVAMLPGIVDASFAMPDAHWGYGFPIGGVAAFDADAGGVVSAGGVGFDISCGEN